MMEITAEDHVIVSIMYKDGLALPKDALFYALYGDNEAIQEKLRGKNKGNIPNILGKINDSIKEINYGKPGSESKTPSLSCRGIAEIVRVSWLYKPDGGKPRITRHHPGIFVVYKYLGLHSVFKNVLEQIRDHLRKDDFIQKYCNNEPDIFIVGEMQYIPTMDDRKSIFLVLHNDPEKKADPSDLRKALSFHEEGRNMPRLPLTFFDKYKAEMKKQYDIIPNANPLLDKDFSILKTVGSIFSLKANRDLIISYSSGVVKMYAYAGSHTSYSVSVDCLYNALETARGSHPLSGIKDYLILFGDLIDNYKLA